MTLADPEGVSVGVGDGPAVAGAVGVGDGPVVAVAVGVGVGPGVLVLVGVAVGAVQVNSTVSESLADPEPADTVANPSVVLVSVTCATPLVVVDEGELRLPIVVPKLTVVPSATSLLH